MSPKLSAGGVLSKKAQAHGGRERPEESWKDKEAASRHPTISNAAKTPLHENVCVSLVIL